MINIDEIIKNNTKLVWFIIHRNFSSYLEELAEDMFQVGCIGLWESVKRFDPNKGKLSTFATRYIDGYIRRFLFRERRYNSRYCLYNDIVPDEYDCEFEDLIVDNSVAFESEIEASETYYRFLLALNDIKSSYRNKVLFRTYIEMNVNNEFENMEKFAQMYGITRQRAEQIIKRLMPQAIRLINSTKTGYEIYQLPENKTSKLN